MLAELLLEKYFEYKEPRARISLRDKSVGITDLPDLYADAKQQVDHVSTHLDIIDKRSRDFPLSEHVLCEGYWRTTEQGELHPAGYRDRVREELGQYEDQEYQFIGAYLEEQMKRSTI